MKPDVVVCWPRNCDYPLWRQFIRDNRDRFNLVIVVFTETNQGHNYREFIRSAMQKDYIYFVDLPYVGPGQDWRNVAIQAALLHSYNSQWVWFTEQDFIIDNPALFWAEVNSAKELGQDIIAVYDGPRMHPCCIFVRRKIATNIIWDFAANPPEYDHFGAFQKDVEGLGIGIHKLQNGYRHLNGLSHNMTLLALGEAPNYKPEEFKAWLKACLDVPSVPLDERFIKLANYAQLNND